MIGRDADGPAMAVIGKAREVGLRIAMMTHRKTVLAVAIAAAALAYWLTPDPPPPPPWIELHVDGAYEVSRKAIVLSPSYVARDTCPGQALWTALVEDVAGRIITQVSRQPARIWLGRHNPPEIRFRWPGEKLPHKASLKVSCTAPVDQTAEAIVPDLPEQSSPIVPVRTELMLPPLGGNAAPRWNDGSRQKEDPLPSEATRDSPATAPPGLTLKGQ